MHKLRRGLLIGCTVLALGAGAATIAAAAIAPGDYPDQRERLMKELGKNMKAINKFVKGQSTESLVEIAARAKRINDLSKGITALFPEGTGPDVFKTSAKPEIWADWAGFEASAVKLTEASSALVEAVRAGDTAAIEAQFSTTGKQGCSGCHAKYREKEE